MPVGAPACAGAWRTRCAVLAGMSVRGRCRWRGVLAPGGASTGAASRESAGLFQRFLSLTRDSTNACWSRGAPEPTLSVIRVWIWILTDLTSAAVVVAVYPSVL